MRYASSGDEYDGEWAGGVPLLADSPGLHAERFREFRGAIARQSITLGLGGQEDLEQAFSWQLEQETPFGESCSDSNKT